MHGATMRFIVLCVFYVALCEKVTVIGELEKLLREAVLTYFILF